MTGELHCPFHRSRFCSNEPVLALSRNGALLRVPIGDALSIHGGADAASARRVISEDRLELLDPIID